MALQPNDLRMNVLKPFDAKWFVKAFEHAQSNPEIIKNDFSATGITDAVKKTTCLCVKILLNIIHSICHFITTIETCLP